MPFATLEDPRLCIQNQHKIITGFELYCDFYFLMIFLVFTREVKVSINLPHVGTHRSLSCNPAQELANLLTKPRCYGDTVKKFNIIVLFLF